MIEEYHNIFNTMRSILEFTPWREAPIPADEMLIIFLSAFSVKTNIEHHITITYGNQGEV